MAVVTNLNSNKAEYWSYRTVPGDRVSTVVATSMALPPVFTPRRKRVLVERQDDVALAGLCSDPSRLSLGDTVRTAIGGGRVLDGTVQQLHAGATADIALHETVLYVDGGLSDNYPILFPRLPAGRTLGLKVEWSNAFTLNTVDKYFSRLAYCALSAAEESAWEKTPASMKDMTICVDVGDVNTIDFQIDDATVGSLLSRGRRAVRDFLYRNGVPTPGTQTVATQTDTP